MYKRTFTLITLAFIFVNIFAQKIPQSFQGKTHMISKDELLKLNEVGKSFVATDPPTGDVRSIAEFERTEGIIVTFRNYSSTNGYFGIPGDLIAEISEDVIVYTIVEDTLVRNTVLDIYNDNEVNMENVIFVYGKTDSYWSRDYSPWFIATDNKVSVVNFPYNRPRPNDDKVPNVFADQFGIDIYGMDLISTGGNYMTDGMGVGASCDLVYEENPSLTNQQIAELAQDFLGLHTYHLLEDPLDDYIEHIDCWGKFLDVDKILITKVPTSDYRYADFEAMADFWANKKSSYGNNYQVYRVYSPNGQPYTNSLILNKKVLVPIVSGYGSDYNDEAIQTYEQAMPGYEVIGFYQDAGAPWESTDALHCRTHEVPDQEMLYIEHLALFDTLPSSTILVDIVSNIVSYGAHDIIDAKLYYKINDGNYQIKDLLNETKESGQYHATIDNLYPGDSVSYYIKSTDNSGRVEFHPFVNEIDPHKFYIRADGTYLSDHFLGSKLKVYPNPAINRVTVTVNNLEKDGANIMIVDINGRVVYNKFIEHTENWMRFNLDVSSLKSGIYIISLNSKNGTNKEKLIIK